MARNIAMALLRRGHRCVVYCPDTGTVADDLRMAGIPVTDDIRSLQQSFDVIHGNHLPTTATAVARFPETPAIFVCQGLMSWHDTPPRFPSIRRYVAVDEAIADRLTVEEGIPSEKTSIILNAVDLGRFKPGPALPTRPRRALAFAKNTGRHLPFIRQVCKARGIELDVVGAAVGRIVKRPEELMPAFDLVFASALTAMEAMACGRAVIVCDERGLAGSVTRDRFQTWRRLNFGFRTLLDPLDAEAIAREVDRYDPEESRRVCLRLREEGGLDAYVEALLALYAQVIEEHRQAPVASDATPMALAEHLQKWSPRLHAGWPWMRERQTLLDAVSTLSFGIKTAWLDAVLQFGKADLPNWWRPLSGFSTPEKWGVWTDGAFASMLFRLEPGTTGDLACRIELMPYVAGETLHAEILVNGIPVDRWDFTREESAKSVFRSLAIPAGNIAADGTLFLAFRMKGARSPRSAGESVDERQLGLGLKNLKITKSRVIDPA